MGYDAVLVDTAGRMQDNEPLMRALAKLVAASDSPSPPSSAGHPFLSEWRMSRCMSTRPTSSSSSARRWPATTPSTRRPDANTRSRELRPHASFWRTRRGRLSVFVGQVTGFNASLAQYAGGKAPRLIDGVILTKFDTINDKVGAALNLVYTTGKPVVFVGVGQTYEDIRNLNVEHVVRALTG